MNVTIFRTRLAVKEPSFTYDVLVDVKELSLERIKQISHFTIGSDGQTYVSLALATIPMSHFDLPRGWDRYEAWTDHRKQTEVLAAQIALVAFPELANRRFPYDGGLYLHNGPDGESHAVVHCSMEGFAA